MKIIPANPLQANTIAKLIMMAMSEECCQNLAGKNHTLTDFEAVLTQLATQKHTQYSYENTLLAMIDNEVAGACVSYDGAKLHRLRQAYIDAAMKHFGYIDPNLVDETQEGELYIDSLAVVPAFRKQGIAGKLIQATVQKAKDMGINHVGLLVDKGNVRAQQFYAAQGFKYVNDTTWGGHEMLHLQIVCR